MVRIILLTIFFIYYQYFFGHSLAFMDVVPNLLLPIVIFVGITKNNNITLIFAFILGVIIDLNTPSCFGISTFLFLIIAFVLGKVKGAINKKQIGLYGVVVVTANLFYFGFRTLIIFAFNMRLGLPILKIIFLSIYSSFFSLIIILIFVLTSKLHISARRF